MPPTPTTTHSPDPSSFTPPLPFFLIPGLCPAPPLAPPRPRLGGRALRPRLPGPRQGGPQRQRGLVRRDPLRAAEGSRRRRGRRRRVAQAADVAGEAEDAGVPGAGPLPALEDGGAIHEEHEARSRGGSCRLEERRDRRSRSGGWGVVSPRAAAASAASAANGKCEQRRSRSRKLFHPPLRFCRQPRQAREGTPDRGPRLRAGLPGSGGRARGGEVYLPGVLPSRLASDLLFFF